MREQRTRDFAIDLTLVSFSQHDLSGTPVCLTSEFAESSPADQILLAFREDAYGCIADDAADAAAKIVVKATRRAFLDGEMAIYNRNSGLLWFVSQSGALSAAAVDKEVYQDQ